jgi:hypothetical protein
MEALTDGIGRGIYREAVEPSSFAHREIAGDPRFFRDGIQPDYSEGLENHRRSFVDREPDLDVTGSQQLHGSVDGHPWIPPTAVKDYQTSAVIRELSPVQAMFDREGQVQVTARPGRRRGHDRLRELGVRKRAVSIELEAHHFEVSAVTVDVLRAGAAATKERYGKRECGEGEPYSAS